MHHPPLSRFGSPCVPLAALALALAIGVPDLAIAQASPFMTGASSLQTNILAWLTPVAIILVMVLGGMAMANRIVENCGNTLILRCAGSENGGTSQFASRLIGQREVLRTSESRSRRGLQLLPSVTRSQHLNIEPAVLDSEIEQLPDLKGYLKFASRPEWRRVVLTPPAAARAGEASVRARTDATRAWGELKTRDAGGSATPERG